MLQSDVTRQRKDTLFRYLAVVWFRAVMPRQALWRVGAQAKVSDTYSREVDPRARVVRGEQVYDREMLGVSETLCMGFGPCG